MFYVDGGKAQNWSHTLLSILRQARRTNIIRLPFRAIKNSERGGEIIDDL